MTADLDELRGWLRIWTGQTVAGNGIGARVENQRIAGHQLANAMPALLDELEQARRPAVLRTHAEYSEALDQAQAEVARLREKADRPSLAELQARYLEVRQHTLSTAHLSGARLIRAEAEYVLKEARELVDCHAQLKRIRHEKTEHDRGRG